MGSFSEPELVLPQTHYHFSGKLSFSNDSESASTSGVSEGHVYTTENEEVGSFISWDGVLSAIGNTQTAPAQASHFNAE